MTLNFKMSMSLEITHIGELSLWAPGELLPSIFDGPGLRKAARYYGISLNQPKETRGDPEPAYEFGRPWKSVKERDACSLAVAQAKGHGIVGYPLL